MTVVQGLCDTSIAPATSACRFGGGPLNWVKTTFSPAFLKRPFIDARSRCWMQPAGRWPTLRVEALLSVDSEPHAARIAASGPVATIPKPVAQHAPRNFRRVASDATP